MARKTIKTLEAKLKLALMGAEDWQAAAQKHEGETEVAYAELERVKEVAAQLASRSARDQRMVNRLDKLLAEAGL